MKSILFLLSVLFALCVDYEEFVRHLDAFLVVIIRDF